MEKVFETQEELTSYITGKVKEVLLLPWKGCMLYAFFANRCKTIKKN